MAATNSAAATASVGCSPITHTVSATTAATGDTSHATTSSKARMRNDAFSTIWRSKRSARTPPTTPSSAPPSMVSRPRDRGPVAGSAE